MPHLSTASKPTRVFLIEDHSIVSTVLAEILNRSGDFTVVGVAGNGTEALEKLATVAADFVIVDLMLPGMSGIEVIQAIRRRFRSLKIIVCSGVNTKPALETALRIGAQAFVEKNSRVEDLLSALRAVVKGEFPLSVGVAARVREIVHQRNSMKPLGRSDLAILRRLAGGASVKEVAATLDVSPSMIYKARRRIAQRTGATDYWDLRAVAAGLGLLHDAFGLVPEAAGSAGSPTAAKS